VEHTFADRLIAWQKVYGRHNLPWQVSDPYRVWLSEIMLQQTQVTTVLGYYERFLGRFPTLGALAAAPLDDVLEYWSGLGYYTRARNLHKAAIMVMEVFGGEFPSAREDIERLPGVGRSTAAAIAAFAFGHREAILDGNVKRVFARVFGIEGFPGEKSVENRMWALAERLLPVSDIAAYTQGLMDLGATVCTRGARAACTVCPMVDACVAASSGRVGQLPAPRPKKTVPTRHTVMMLAVEHGRVLLTRRPPTGIWGGLLSLPEFATSLEVDDWLEHSGEGDVLPAWDEFEHVFSHYKLLITPVPVRLTRWVPTGLGESSSVWLPLDTAADAGVPAPVRRLLLKLANPD